MDLNYSLKINEVVQNPTNCQFELNDSRVVCVLNWARDQRESSATSVSWYEPLLDKSQRERNERRLLTFLAKVMSPSNFRVFKLEVFVERQGACTFACACNCALSCIILEGVELCEMPFSALSPSNDTYCIDSEGRIWFVDGHSLEIESSYALARETTTAIRDYVVYCLKKYSESKLLD